MIIRMVEGLATALGYLVRVILWAGQVAVYAAGPLLIYYGLSLIYRPAAYIAVGLVLTALTFRKTTRGAK